MKINRGTITGVSSGKTAKITVRPSMTDKRKNTIALCVGAIVVGIYGIVRETFLATVEGYEKAEFKAYEEVDAIAKDEKK